MLKLEFVAQWRDETPPYSSLLFFCLYVHGSCSVFQCLHVATYCYHMLHPTCKLCMWNQLTWRFLHKGIVFIHTCSHHCFVNGNLSSPISAITLLLKVSQYFCFSFYHQYKKVEILRLELRYTMKTLYQFLNLAQTLNQGIQDLLYIIHEILWHWAKTEEVIRLYLAKFGE